MAKEIGVVCGEDCPWKCVSVLLSAIIALTFLVMAIKLIDARHEIAALKEATLEARSK